MNYPDIKESLSILIRKIGKNKINWYLEGSTNPFVQGLPINPNDIDITTDAGGLGRFREILKNETIRYFYIKETKAHLLKCKIKDCEIEIAVYKEKNKSSFSTIKIISWQDLILPTQPLSQALKFYKLIGRKDKVELIEKFLTSN